MDNKEGFCTKPIMQDSDAGKRLHNLRWRRARKRENTRFITQVGKLTDTTTQGSYEYYKFRLRETGSTNEPRRRNSRTPWRQWIWCGPTELWIIHRFRNARHSTEFASDRKAIGNFDSECHKHRRQRNSRNGNSDWSIGHENLPLIKRERFSGDIKKWTCFSEQFKQSVDNDPSLTTISKHILLHSYLAEEPKHLVEDLLGSPKRMRRRKYLRPARQNRTIHAQLDYLEDEKPINTLAQRHLIRRTYTVTGASRHIAHLEI